MPDSESESESDHILSRRRAPHKTPESSYYGSEFGRCRISNFSYSTFPIDKEVQKRHAQCWWAMVLRILTGKEKRETFHRGLSRNMSPPVVAALGLCAITMLFKLHLSSTFSSRTASHQAPVWEWYHYHYYPKQKGTARTTIGARNLLVVQMSGPGPVEDMADITSRPNRAYSKQWGIDFLRYSSTDGRECFHKLVVLDTLLKRQELSLRDEEQGSSSDDDTERNYDAVLFLPADSIITDLDFDLLSLLPKEKLVAVATLMSDEFDLPKLTDLGRSESGILMWNLNHPQSQTAAALWLEFVQHPRFDCTGSTELGLLLSVVESLVMYDENKDVSDFVQPLEETEKGFVSPRVIKFVPSYSSEARLKTLMKNIYDTTAMLESDSDSVCYRYYPKCEVL